MSEWKWCQDCSHHYNAHEHAGAGERTPCTLCGCEAMSWDMADLY